MKLAFLLLLCVAAVSSFTAVERTASGAGLENEDFGDLFEYEVDYGFGSGLDRADLDADDFDAYGGLLDLNRAGSGSETTDEDYEYLFDYGAEYNYEYFML